jgi:hypothetical protein
VGLSSFEIAKLKSAIAVMHDETLCHSVDDLVLGERSLLPTGTKIAITHMAP